MDAVLNTTVPIERCILKFNRRFFQRYGLQSLGLSVKGPIKIFSDSQSVLDSSTTPGTELKRKHVALAFHAVREAYAHNIISLHKISTNDNISDICTKVLGPITSNVHVDQSFGKPIKIIPKK